MKQPLFELIRNHVKANGITQMELAKQLGVSLPTVKRWLQGSGIVFDDLLRLLQATGHTLAEAAMMAEGARARTFCYTLVQEETLARSVALLVVFDALLHGASILEISKSEGLSRHAISRILKQLEAVGLVERHPGDRIKIIPRGEPMWRKGGPLARAFKEKAVFAFLRTCQKKEGASGMGIYRLVNQDFLKAQVMINDLRQFLRESEVRAKGNLGDSRMVALLTAFNDFNWSMIAD